MDMSAVAFREDCHYSVVYALYRTGDELGGRVGLHRLSWSCNQKKHQWILNYLKNKYSVLLEQYCQNEDLGTKVENAPIWICWWQGLENSPMLVKKCIESIKDNAGMHPVHLITNENVQDYIEIPQYILEKVVAKDMGLAHYADYLRVSLLHKYGGLWLDATIFCANQITENYFEYPFFSIKNECKKTKYISQYQWNCFCLGAWKGHALLNFLKEAMELYWSTEKKAVDYLFFDYLLWLGLSYVPAASCYEQVPINNIHCDDLRAAMNAKTLAEMWDDILCEDTIFYKLSWREKYEMLTQDGEKTVYTKLLET